MGIVRLPGNLEVLTSVAVCDLWSKSYVFECYNECVRFDR